MVTSRIINQIYNKCIATNKEKELRCIEVNGMTGGIHSFSSERLENEFNHILMAITKLPTSLRYSYNPEGEAWIMARTGNGPLSGMSMLTTERLLVMAIAVGIVRVVPHEELLCDIPYVVIDDVRSHRIEMTKPRLQRNWMLIKWPIYNF